MAIKLTDQKYCPYSRGFKCEYLCDTDEDFANLPQSCTGSIAVSIASGQVRVVNTQGEWVAFGG